MRTLLIASLSFTAGCLTDAAPPDPDDDRAADLARKRCRGAFDCDDGNACTTDACVGGACVFTAVTAPTACDDANPCTWDDACVGTACVGVATLPLLSGDATPAGEGWTGYLETAATTSDGQVITVDTAASPSTQSVSTWGHPLAATWFATHDLEWRARVITATSNPYDGSAVVFPAFSGWYGVGVEREQMVMLENAAVTWGDQSQSYPVATTAWHTYRLTFPTTGGLALYVDGAPALTRASFTAGAAIGFGDHTNDAGYDGTFQIDAVRLVPGPSCPVGPPPPPPL